MEAVMKNRERLISKLQERMMGEHSDKKALDVHFQDLKQFGFSESDSGPYLHMRKSLDDADDFLLFCLTYTYYKSQIDDYFLPKEIETYGNLKYEKEELSGDIKIKAIKVSDNQWIGTISTKELMLWRNAQIINYNENAQRTMKHITRRGQDFYQIYLNKKAVSDIKSIMLEGQFIPNTLTFNMSEDADYNYDENENILTIDVSEKKLDILDGYHRYIAISQIYNDNPDFDMNMEIRIVSFPESTSQQFIWQEDQKTKMRKSQSDAMNQLKLANQITQRINDSGECDFYHNISPNGIINKGDFSVMIERVYCNNVSKKKELEVQKKTVKKLIDYLNGLSDVNEELLSMKWDRLMIYAAVFMSKADIEDKITRYNKFCELYEIISSDENRKYMFKTSEITRNDISKLTRFSKEVLADV